MKLLIVRSADGHEGNLYMGLPPAMGVGEASTRANETIASVKERSGADGWQTEDIVAALKEIGFVELGGWVTADERI